MTASIDTFLSTTATPTREELAAAIDAFCAISEAIRLAETIPSGHLYAQICGIVTIGGYEAAIALLKRVGVVEESAHMLRWIGPKAGARP